LRHRATDAAQRVGEILSLEIPMRSILKAIPMKLPLVVFFCICQLPSVANAQITNLQGKFRLQHEVQWGKAALPPGDYSVTIYSEKDSSFFALVRSRDGKETAFAMPTAAGRPEPGGSYILITNDGTPRVRLLNLPEAQLSLTFGPLTKQQREVLRADQSRVVPVVVAHK
jgi:hypothetical protein